jgi:hypothetical protein
LTKTSSRLAILLLCGVTIGLLSGCIAVPPHDGLARVHVNDVIKRVKCDIAETVLRKAMERTPDGRTPFVFLANWAAKVHLTIIVDDTASLNPGATAIEALPAVGGVSQSFSMGIGAGGITEAVRQEDIEFLFSFPDVIAEFSDAAKRRDRYQDCRFDQGVLLESDLGLKPLIDSALKPVETQVLNPGQNVGPGVTAVAISDAELKGYAAQLKKLSQATQGLPQTATISDLLKNNPHLEALIQGFGIPSELKGKTNAQIQSETGRAPPPDVIKAKTLLSNADTATKTRTSAEAIINDVVTPLYAISSSGLDTSCLREVTDDKGEATTLLAKLALSSVAVGQATDVSASDKALQDLQDYFKQLVAAAQKMVNDIGTCASAAKKKGKPVKLYDPIDLISETVNFYITLSGSLTPTWKLVKATAPIAPTFFSVSRKDTNTLILALGRPATTAEGTLSGSTPMSNQILASLISQAISNLSTGTH